MDLRRVPGKIGKGIDIMKNILIICALLFAVKGHASRVISESTENYLKSLDNWNRDFDDCIEQGVRIANNRDPVSGKKWTISIFKSPPEFLEPWLYVYFFHWPENIPVPLTDGHAAEVTCASPMNGPRISSYEKPQDRRITEETKACGSVINFSKKTVAESIPIAGVNFNLNYSSEFNTVIDQHRKVESKYTFREVPSDEFKLTILDSNRNEVQSYSYVTMPPYMFNTEYVVPQSSNLWITDSFKSSVKLLVEMQGFKDIPGLCNEVSLGVNPQTGQEEFEVRCEPATRKTFTLSADEKNIVLYKPEVWGLSGWTISEHHYFDRNSKFLFTGDGERLDYSSFQEIADPDLGQIDVVVSKYDEEVFIFDQLGRHLETRDAIQGYIIHKFKYASDNKLISIEDRFGSKTKFIYDGNGELAKIVSPYGVETIFQVSQGRIIKATDPQQLSYEMSYDSSDLLKTFKSVDNVTTTFIYTADGAFVREEKNTGIFQYFTETFDENIKVLTKYFHFGIAKRIKEVLTEYGVESHEVDSENRLVSKQVKAYANNQTTTTYSNESMVEYFTNPWEWGNDRPYVNRIEHSAFTPEEDDGGGGDDDKREQQGFREITESSEARNYGTSVLDLQLYEERISSRGAQFVTSYDKSSNIMSDTDQFGVTTSTEFNELGLVTKVSRIDEYPTSFEYDQKGRLTKVKKGQQFTSYGYDANGYLASTNNSKNQLTQYLRNKKGQLVQKIFPNQDSVKYEYTDGGEIKKIITPNNQVHNFQFDLGDYVSRAITPGNKTTYYEYDSDKRLTLITKPSGKKLKYEYAQGKEDLERVLTPDGNITINSRDLNSKITEITSADDIKTKIVWLADQVQSQTWYDNGEIVATLSNTYDRDKFQVNGVYLNNQLIAGYTYGPGGIFKSIENLGMNYTYDFGEFYNNLKITTTTGNFSVDYTQQDNLNGEQPTQLVSAKVYDGPQSQLFINLKRTYDMFGQATEFMTTTMNHETGVYNSYYSLVPEYDSNNRLIKINKTRKSFDNGHEVNSVDFMNSYSYPANSNNNVKTFEQRISVDQNPTKRTVASHNNDDQLTKLHGSINRDYKYNEDGELSELTNCFGTTTYQYDSLGNLKKVSFPNGKIVEYKVDAQNRRFKKMINGQVNEYYIWYDQTRLAAVLDANKQPKEVYIYGAESAYVPSYLVKDGKTYKIIHDPGMQSVRYVVDTQSAKIVQETEYDEYGNFMKNTNPNFQYLAFAGGLYDQDTKFLRFGARDYDPTIGRWTTKDPVEFDSGDTNLYVYVSGNPTSMIDPDGESGLPGAFVGAAFEIAIQAANLKAQGKDVYDYKNYDGYDIAIAAAVGAIAPGILNLGKTSLKSSLAIKTLSKQLKNAKTLNRVAKVQSRIAKNRNKIAKIVATQSAYQIVKTKLKKVNNPSCE